ncbi:hypothetical protein GCM10023116_20560 [Kistimonas scapharcae]|uniref:Uncharacterized protein n=1 Tax=Kistimonas scapharcae TaxID=1036133 RepID=A0ABP8V3Y8_9GAMM
MTAFGAYLDLNKPVFPFAEPSHFALAYFPFSLLYMLKEKSNAFLVLPITLIFGISFPNLTFVIIFFIQLLILAPLRYLFFSFTLVLCISLLIPFLEFIDFDYFTSRIIFDPSNMNISNLVYLKGWEAAYIALSDSFFLGMGFQNMGFERTGYYSDLLFLIYKGELNRYDGSFLASKIIVEFGFLGVLFSIFVTWQSLKSYLFLRATKFCEGDLVSIIYAVVTLAVFVELFFRGISYFSPNFIVFLVLVAKNSIPFRNKLNAS